MLSNVTRTVYKVNDFISWQRANTLTLSPSFQRRSVWKPGAKSLLIDTVARGLPIPIVFLREKTDFSSAEPMREVVDGQQRLRTLITYIAPEAMGPDFDSEREGFVVKKSHNSELAGKPFRSLHVDIRRRILGYEFSVHVLPAETEDREVLQIFARMNATGVKLNPQELRNAEYYGEFKQTVYRLAYEQLSLWRKWRIFSETDIARMIEAEEVSELVVMMLTGVHGKSQNRLNGIYEESEEDFDSKDEVVRRFRLVIEYIDDNFGTNLTQTAFSRRSLFYTLFCFFYDLMFGIGSSLTPSDVNRIPANAIVAVQKASDQIQSGNLEEELSNLLRGATSHAESRRARLNFIKQILSGLRDG